MHLNLIYHTYASWITLDTGKYNVVNLLKLQHKYGVQEYICMVKHYTLYSYRLGCIIFNLILITIPLLLPKNTRNRQVTRIWRTTTIPLKKGKIKWTNVNKNKLNTSEHTKLGIGKKWWRYIAHNNNSSK